MKRLLDENISDRLLSRLENLYPDSKHICTAGFRGAEDTAIWEYAKQHDFYIVTQDADFAVRTHLYGAPPKVVWLSAATHPRVQSKRS